MKAFLLLLFLLLLTSPVWGQEQFDVYNDKGERQGYTRQDPYNDNRMNLYSKDGKRTGYVERDPYSSDRFNVFDEKGRRKGYVKGNRFYEK